MTRLLTRLCLIGCLLAAFVGPAWALEDVRERLLHNATASDLAGESLSLERFSTVSVDVTISGTATVTFEGSTSGTGWTGVGCIATNDTAGSPVLTTDVSGMYQCNVAGFAAFHAPVSGCAACTVTVFARGTTGSFAKRGGGGGTSGLDANFDFTNGNEITGATEARPLKIRGSGAQSTSGWNIYQHSDGTPTIKCVIADVEGDCNVTVSLNDNKKYQIKDFAGNIIFEADEATGYTRFTDEKHFPVATCNNATPSAVFDLPTANTPAPVCEGTNHRMATLDFDDTTDEFFDDTWTLPASFGGTINGHFRWKGAATTNAVGWCMQLVRVPDGATSDPAFPAQAAGNCVSDTAKGTTLQENVATITGVTCTSCVAGDRVNVRISRDANGGAVTDSFVGDAKLITYGRTIR